MASQVCDECGAPVDGGAVVTVVGREICQDCADRALGTAAGALAAGSDAGPTGGVGQAVATAGWFSGLRRRRRERKEADRPPPKAAGAPPPGSRRAGRPPGSG